MLSSFAIFNMRIDINRSKIYPNPTKDFIEFKNIKNGSKISIYSLSGELVEKYIYNSCKYSLENPFTTGIYLVEVQQNLNKEYFKIIKF